MNHKVVPASADVPDTLAGRDARAPAGSEPSVREALHAALSALGAYRETEGLVLSRRALRLAESANDAEGAAHAQSLLSAAIEGLEDWDALEAECERLDERAAALPADRRGAIEMATLRRRAAVALGRGDGDAAERHLIAAGEVARAEGQVGPLAELLPFDLAEVWLAQGRLGDAERAIDVFVSACDGPLGDVDALLADATRARAAFRSGAPDASERVASVLSRLSDTETYASGLRRAVAVALANDLEMAKPADPLVDRAFEAAARASVERALAIQAFLTSSGAQVEIEPRDLALLARARDRAVERSPRLVVAIARGLPSSPAEQAFVERRSGLRTRVVVCAWCGRIRAPGAAWVPVQQLVPIDSSTGWGVTHGICEECRRTTGTSPN